MAARPVFSKSWCAERAGSVVAMITWSRCTKGDFLPVNRPGCRAGRNPDRSGVVGTFQDRTAIARIGDPVPPVMFRGSP